MRSGGARGPPPGPLSRRPRLGASPSPVVRDPFAPGTLLTPPSPGSRSVHAGADSLGELGEPAGVRTLAWIDTRAPGRPGHGRPRGQDSREVIARSHTPCSRGAWGRGRLAARGSDRDPFRESGGPVSPGAPAFSAGGGAAVCRVCASKGESEKENPEGRVSRRTRPGGTAAAAPRCPSWRARLGALGGVLFYVSQRAWTPLEPWVAAYCSLYLLGTERF